MHTVKDELGYHQAIEEEMKQVYFHIINGML